MNSLPSKVLSRIKRQSNRTMATADLVSAFGPSARNALNKLIQTGALVATDKPMSDPLAPTPTAIAGALTFQTHLEKPFLPDDGPNYELVDGPEPVPGSAEVVQRSAQTGKPLPVDGAPFSDYGSQWLQNMVFTAAEVPSHERREVFATACEILKALVR